MHFGMKVAAISSFFNSQTDGYVCTRCMRMGEKLHKLKEDLRETQNQLRELAVKLTRGETTKTMLCLSSFLILDSS